MMKPSVRFRNAFEQKCYQLIIDAFQTSITEKVIQLDWNENDITFELYEIMERNSERVTKFQIHLTTEYRTPKDVSKTKGFSDKLPRIDLKMAHFASMQEFKYFFEAKRLKENSSVLKRAYIDEGMDRFISEKYPIGSMLAYLLEGKTDKTIDGINNLLKKDKRHSEVLFPKPIKLLKTVYESSHVDIGTLKHLLFDFTTI